MKTFVTRRPLSQMKKTDPRTLEKKIESGEVKSDAMLFIGPKEVVPVFEVNPLEVRKLGKK